MNDAFIAFIVYLFLCMFLGPVVVALWELLCALSGYAGLVLREAAVVLAQGLWLLLRQLFRALLAAARGAWLATVFLYFLAAEAVRGDRQEDAHAEEDGGAAGDPDNDGDADVYQAALTLLGLPATFTRAQLDAAFKAAIKKAHPDAGGSVDQAQAVNMARDLLLPHAI